MNQAEWLAAPIDPRSHAWCGDCDWKIGGEWSHKHASDHGTMLHHITHVYEAEEADPAEWHHCKAMFLGDALFSCKLTRNHEGRHEDGGFSWSGGEAVDNLPTPGDNS